MYIQYVDSSMSTTRRGEKNEMTAPFERVRSFYKYINSVHTVKHRNIRHICDSILSYKSITNVNIKYVDSSMLRLQCALERTASPPTRVDWLTLTLTLTRAALSTRSEVCALAQVPKTEPLINTWRQMKLYFSRMPAGHKNERQIRRPGRAVNLVVAAFHCVIRSFCY